jgi:hypothetical protein
MFDLDDRGVDSLPDNRNDIERESTLLGFIAMNNRKLSRAWRLVSIEKRTEQTRVGRKIFILQSVTLQSNCCSQYY